MDEPQKTNLLPLLLVTLIGCAALWYQANLINRFEFLINEDIHHEQQVQKINYLFKVQVLAFKESHNNALFREAITFRKLAGQYRIQ